MVNEFYTDFDLERRESRPEDVDDTRTKFQCDRDGVIYSSAFRRLQAKTQVFLSGEFDFYRTRLTHSIEVAQIGRAICHRLLQTSDVLNDSFFIDADLVEAACLAHDIGHPPFGHAGERTLHELMREGLGGFEGNAQSLRILTETIYSSGGKRRGLKPTRAFIDSTLKYKRIFDPESNPKNHFLYADQESWLEFVFGGRDLATELGEDDVNAFRSIECQIMDWADDTAYSINDVADSVNAGFIGVESIKRWAVENGHEGCPHIARLCEMVADGKVEAWAGKKVGYCVNACELIEWENFMSERTNRYRFQLKVDEDVVNEIAMYKKLSLDLVFRSARIHQLEYKGDQILRKVFTALLENYGKSRGVMMLLGKGQESLMSGAASDDERVRLLCDYIAGMTDGFAVRTYKRLFDPDYGSIADLH